MAWTAPKTMGNEPTIYTDWNTYVRDNLNYLEPKVSAIGLFTIAETILAVDTAAFDFTSISAAYRSLKIVLSGRGAAAGIEDDEVRVRFNGDGAANYAFQRIASTAAYVNSLEGVATAYSSLGKLPAATAPAGAGGCVEILLADYSRTIFHKTILAEATHRRGAASEGVVRYVVGGHWQSTAAINRVYLYLEFGDFLAGTVATLYGLQ